MAYTYFLILVIRIGSPSYLCRQNQNDMEVKEIKIVHWDIAPLIEPDYNPRKISAQQRDEIRKLIVSFGFVQPLVVNTHEGRENIVADVKRNFVVDSNWTHITDSEVIRDIIENTTNIARQIGAKVFSFSKVRNPFLKRNLGCRKTILKIRKIREMLKKVSKSGISVHRLIIIFFQFNLLLEK